MKKFVLTAVMAVLFFVGLSSMITMNSAQDPYPGCQEDCEFLVGIGLFSSHGACMSACHTCTNPGKGANRAVCFCKLIDAEFGLENYGLNFGQCVNIIKNE